MTKKHFIAFAAAIKTKFAIDKPWDTLPVEKRRAVLDTIEIVEMVALESNDRFDSRRFRDACGVPA